MCRYRFSYFALSFVDFLFFIIDSEGYEFQLISMDRQWHFEATGPDERDEWVMFIERAIMTRLQLNESNKRTRAGGNVGLGSGNSFAGSSSNMVGVGSRATSDSNSLTSGRSGAGDTSEMAVTEQLVQSIRSAAGNDFCADCGAPGEFSYLLGSYSKIDQIGNEFCMMLVKVESSGYLPSTFST